MAQFQQMVLDYLEQYEPGRYEQLKNQRRLLSSVKALAECMYEETDRIKTRLKATETELSEEQIRIEAEALAAAQFLPLPDGESNGWEAQQ